MVGSAWARPSSVRRGSRRRSSRASLGWARARCSTRPPAQRGARGSSCCRRDAANSSPPTTTRWHADCSTWPGSRPRRRSSISRNGRPAGPPCRVLGSRAISARPFHGSTWRIRSPDSTPSSPAWPCSGRSLSRWTTCSGATRRPPRPLSTWRAGRCLGGYSWWRPPRRTARGTRPAWPTSSWPNPPPASSTCAHFRPSACRAWSTNRSPNRRPHWSRPVSQPRGETPFCSFPFWPNCAGTPCPTTACTRPRSTPWPRAWSPGPSAGGSPPCPPAGCESCR